MSEWLAGLPPWAVASIAAGLLIVGVLIGRWSKRTVIFNMKQATAQLRRIADKMP